MYSRLNKICLQAVIIISLLLVLTVPSAARIYMAPNGSDASGTGTMENPYQSLRHIAQYVLTPGTGDTVIVMEGTYPSQGLVGFNFRVRGGGPDDYLVIMGDPAASSKPVIDADKSANVCLLLTADYSEPTNNNPEDDIAFIKLKDIVFTNSSQQCVNIDDGGHPDASHDSRGTPAHHIIIEGCEFSRSGIPYHGLKMAGVDTFLVKDCVFTDIQDPMLDMVGCHYGTIQNCQFIDADIAWQRGSGLVAKGGSSNITIDRCYFRACGYNGVNIGQATGSAFFRPPLYELDGEGETMDYEAKNIKVYRSVFVNIQNPIKFASSRGGGVYNCTFYCPVAYSENEPTSLAFMFNMYSFQTSVGGYDLVWPRDGEVVNNIAYYNGTWGYENWVIMVQSSTTLPETFLFSHNIWHNMQDPAESEPDWDLLANHYGCPQHDNDLTGDPQFITSNPSLPSHFQLTEGSPAAAIGTALNNEIYDHFNERYIDGLDYNNRAWSDPPALGAFGTASEAAPPIPPTLNAPFPAELGEIKDGN